MSVSSIATRRVGGELVNFGPHVENASRNLNAFTRPEIRRSAAVVAQTNGRFTADDNILTGPLFPRVGPGLPSVQITSDVTIPRNQIPLETSFDARGTYTIQEQGRLDTTSSPLRVNFGAPSSVSIEPQPSTNFIDFTHDEVQGILDRHGLELEVQLEITNNLGTTAHDALAGGLDFDGNSFIGELELLIGNQSIYQLRNDTLQLLSRSFWNEEASSAYRRVNRDKKDLFTLTDHQHRGLSATSPLKPENIPATALTNGVKNTMTRFIRLDPSGHLLSQLNMFAFRKNRGAGLKDTTLRLAYKINPVGEWLGLTGGIADTTVYSAIDVGIKIQRYRYMTTTPNRHETIENNALATWNAPHYARTIPRLLKHNINNSRITVVSVTGSGATSVVTWAADLRFQDRVPQMISAILLRLPTSHPALTTTAVAGTYLSQSWTARAPEVHTARYTQAGDDRALNTEYDNKMAERDVVETWKAGFRGATAETRTYHLGVEGTATHGSDFTLNGKEPGLAYCFGQPALARRLVEDGNSSNLVYQIQANDRLELTGTIPPYALGTIPTVGQNINIDIFLLTMEQASLQNGEKQYTKRAN